MGTAERPEATGADAAALLDCVREGLARAGEPEAEVHASRTRRGLARFANNVLGQHIDNEEVQVAVRVARERRVALATGSRLDPAAIAAAIADAAELCAHVPPVEAFPGFAGPATWPIEAPAVPYATRDATPEARAECLGPAFAEAARRGLTLSGTLETAVHEAAVATSNGQALCGATGRAATRLFARTSDGESGFGGGLRADLTGLDVAALAHRAMARCERARRPEPLEPGRYDVVLEPPAVAELLEWFGIIGFSAREVADGRSFLATRRGKPLGCEGITLVDDPPEAVAAGLALPFDREGTPSARVPLIDAGVARGPVYDRLYAARAGVASTGHAVMLGGELLPGNRALRMLPGGESLDSLVSGLDRGLVVSRLHYVNGLLDPPNAAMTGMTRDGTFWVERGRRVHAVRNMRFNERILEAFARADGIGAELEPVPTWWSPDGILFVPAVRIRNFRFTGAAEEP